MTAPAVVRHWNDPPPIRSDRRVPDSADRGDCAPAGGPGVVDRFATVARVATVGALARLRRVAPLGAVLVTTVVAHIAIAPHLALRGTAADVLLVSVVGVSVARGPRAGAAFGFAAGLGADLFLTTPLGTSALAYTLVGHALGGVRRSRPSGSSAAALCGPDTPCFACRSGRVHSDGRNPGDLPSRARRRAAARRAALRRSVILTLVGVAGGRLAAAIVATTLGGVPFPEASGLVRIAGVAALSAPLGPAAMALGGRLRRVAGGTS